MGPDETAPHGRPAYASPRLLRLSQPGGTLAACSPGSNLVTGTCSNSGLSASQSCNSNGGTADTGCNIDGNAPIPI